jgi:hypothetical protein
MVDNSAGSNKELAVLAELLAGSFTTNTFPKLWAKSQENVKCMKKKDVAHEMFYAGASQMLNAFLEIINDDTAREELKNSLISPKDSFAHLN